MRSASRLAIGVALVLIAGALWLALTGPAPAAEALALTAAACVALGTWASPVLGLLALVAAASTHAVAIPSALGWTALMASGLACGLVARHVASELPRLVGRDALGSGIWLALAVAVVSLLPADFVQLLDPSGAPLVVGVGVSDPATAARALVDVPALVPHVRPLQGLLALLPIFGGLAAFALAVAGARDGGWRYSWVASCVVGAAAAAVGAAGLGELLVGAVTVPGPDAWIVELGWLGGGAIGTTTGPLPEQAWLGLASRPMVDVLLLTVGLALAGLGARHAGRTAAPATLAAPVSAGWTVPVIIAAVAAGVVAAGAGLPGALGWASVASTLFVTAALIGALFRAGDRRWAVDLQVLAVVTWIFGLIAPLAGWAAQ